MWTRTTWILSRAVTPLLWAGLALAGSSLPAKAYADETAAIALIGLGPAEAKAIHAKIFEQLKAQGVRLLDRSTTETAIRTFLGKPLVGASTEAILDLSRQMGVNHFVVVRELSHDAADRVTIVQARVYDAYSEPTIRMGAVPEGGPAMAEQLTAMLLELLPREQIVPSEEAPAAEPETSHETTPRVVPNRSKHSRNVT